MVAELLERLEQALVVEEAEALEVVREVMQQTTPTAMLAEEVVAAQAEAVGVVDITEQEQLGLLV